MTKRIHLAVYDTLSDWEVGYAIAHINKKDWQKQPGQYEVVTMGLSAEPVTTMGGLRVVPQVAVADVKPADSSMLILAGSDTWGPVHTDETTPFTDLAGEFLEAGVPVAAICGGTLGLAAAGLLNDRAHTSNAAQYLGMAPAYTGAELYRDEPTVIDRGLITAGAMNPVAFARSIFAELDLYSPAVLRAWYELYGDRDPQGFFKLMTVAAAEQSAS